MENKFKCTSCGWSGSAEQAMKPVEEIREEWESVWKFRKGLTDEFGTQFYLGTLPWEKEMLDDLVCPKCAGECNRVTEE